MALSVKLPFGKSGAKVYTCRNCSFSTKYDVLYKMHIQRCSSTHSTVPRGPNLGQSIPRNYTCSSCDYKTSQSRLYLVHQVQEHKASYPIYPCEFCGYATRYRNKLIRHHTNIHLDRGVLQEKDVLPLAPPIDMQKVEADLIAKGFTVETEDEDNKPLAKLKSTTSKGISNQQSSSSGSSKLSNSPNSVKSSEYIYEVPVEGLSTTEFRCKLCTYKSPHRWSAMKHVRNMHINGKLYCCDKCNFSTAKKIEFSIHRAKHANQRMFNCKECEYETNQKSNLERHMANHTGHGPMKCELCSYSSTGGPAILRHMQEHHRGAAPTATIPDEDASVADAGAEGSDSADPEYIQMVDYEQFQKSTVDNDVYMEGNMDDSIMTDDFLSPDNFLTNDNTSNNSVGETSLTENVSKQPMKCPLCHLELPNERQLRNHILMHPKFQPWICPDCKCKYRRSSDLSRHLRKKHDRHISEYPRDSLMVLSIVKSDDGKAIVSIKEDCYSGEDSNDDTTVTGEQPLDLSVKPEMGARKVLFQPQFHKCKFCSYRAKFPADIRRHMSLSHRNRMAQGRFACTNCERTYKYRSDLYVHMRKAHRIDTGKLKPVQPVQAQPFRDSGMETDLGVSQLNENDDVPVTKGESLLFSKPKKAPEKPKLKETSPNKHKCLYCDYIGNCKSEIDRHTLTHTGQKPFQCMFCEYKTIWKGDMKRHLPKHHAAEVDKSDIITLLEKTYRPDLITTESDKEIPDDPDMYNDSATKFGIHNDMMDINEPTKPSEPYTMEQLYGPSVFEAGIYEAGTVVVIPEAPDDAEAHAKEQEQFAAQFNNQYPELNDNPEYIDLEPDYAIPGMSDVMDTNSNSSLSKSSEVKSETKYAGGETNDSNNNDEDEFLIDTDPENGKKTVYCPKCPFTCEAPSKMKSHVAIHENVKRYKCNYCGKRSNWLWDVRKHIKRDHPDDDYKNVTELSLEEARATLNDYLKKSGHRTIKTFIGAKKKPITDSPSQVSRNSTYYSNPSTGKFDVAFQAKDEQYSPNGYEGLDLTNPANYKKIPPQERYRPFKCSNCGKRSNWKHDMLKHIRSHHQGDGEVIILSLQEARESLEKETSSGSRSRSVTPSPMGTPSSSSSKATAPSPSPSLQTSLMKRSPGGGVRCGGVKRFKCSECPYRSDYSSDIQRHIPRRHSNSQAATMIIMTYEEAADSIDQYDYDWVKNRAKPGFGVDPRATRNNTEGAKTKTYRCSKCEYRAKDRETVLQHLRREHHSQGKPSSLKCKICTYSSAHRASVRRHLREAHKTTDYENLIVKRYGKPSEVPGSENNENDTKEIKEFVHSRVDPRAGRFKCGLCGFLSPWKHSLERHIRNRHPDGDVERDLIMRSKIAKKPGSFAAKPSSPSVKTEEYQMENGAYCCNICPYKTKKVGLYRLHLSRHKPSPGNNRICKYCPFYTCNTRLLGQHVELHLNDPRGVWACSENKSSKSVSQDTKLGRHRSYFCEKCPYIGKNLSDFLYHKQFHRPRANAPYKCEICPYYASLKRIISQHKKVHDPKYKTLLKSIGRYPAGQNITMLEASPAKTDVSEGSYCNYDAVQMANLKQSIIMSKVRSVPISPNSIKTHDVPMTPGSAMRDNKDPNLMYGCVVSKTGVVMNSSFYRKLHTCQFCPYTNPRAANVKLHEKMHGPREGRDVSKCPYCDYHVGNKGLLSHHLKVHSQQYNPYRDEINDTEADDDETSEHSGENGDSAQSTTSEAATPQTTPVKLDPNRIPSDTGFYIKYDEKTGEHRLESIRFKKWCCERCPYATAKQAQFERHVKLHGSKQKYTCEYCDYSVPGYYLLMQHKSLHLYPNPNLLVTQSVSNLMKLPEVPADIAAAANFPTISDKGNDQTNLVHDHLALYENSDSFTEPKKLYRCDRCPYANVQRSHLLAHLKCHVIKNALQCPHCDYSVSKQHLLLQHIKIHFSHPDLMDTAKETEETACAEGDSPEELKQKDGNLSGCSTMGVGAEPMDQDEEVGEGISGNASSARSSEDGDAEQSKPSACEGTDDKNENKAELNNNNITEEEDTLWICQYCDRAFAASEKLLQHEMQHLVGNKV